jgi:protein phosphatase 1 regulatory subunit 7
MTDANPPTGNAVNSSSLQNSSSSQHATIIPASESHQKDPTSKHSPVRSTKSGWDGKLRIGDSQRTGQNDHGHDGKEEEADEDDDDDDDEDDSSSNDNESQATQSQLLDSSSLATTAATSIHDDDAQLAHLAAAAAPGRTAILQTGPAVEGGPPIDADEDLLDEYDSDAEEIDLVHCRVSSLAHLQLQRFAQLQRLCLRQNAIEDMAELPAHLAPELVELDLYDNLLRHIRGLDGFVKLRSLDLSFNNIKHIKRVAQCTELTDLYFVQNKISTIENLEGLSKLRNLELGGNRLRSIDGLETLTGLEELWLGKNKITEIKVSIKREFHAVRGCSDTSKRGFRHYQT